MPQFGLPGEVCTPVRSGPERTEPCRSGTSPLTPLSITATVTPEPRLICQAAGALTASSTHSSALRTLSARAGAAAPAIRADDMASVSPHDAPAATARDRRPAALSIPPPSASRGPGADRLRRRLAEHAGHRI